MAVNFRKYRLIVLAACLGLFVVPCLAKGWRNITLLKTTRAEVIQMLGEPKPYLGTNGPEYFEYENDRIFIIWARSDCITIGKKVAIDEESATPDSLVYEITVEPRDLSKAQYEKEVHDFLIAIHKPDCVGPQGGACGIFDAQIGFGYSRSDLGVKRLQYMTTLDEATAWIRTLPRCPPATPIVLKNR